MDLQYWIGVSITVGLSILVSLLTFWGKNAKYQQKVDHIEKEVDKNHLVANEFRIDIATLKEFKVQAQKFIDKSIYKSSSPLSLTSLGEELVSNSGFKDIFEIEKDNLVKMLEAKKLTTKYDVQEMSRELMDGLRAYEAFTPIKSFAFNNGKDFGQILRAGAILLRDYYLKIHPEITV